LSEVIFTSEERRREEREDVEELREVLKAVSDFLKEIKPSLEELLKVFVESVSGDKLAKEVSTFYKSLIESGVDPQTAKEWTNKFFEERLKSLPSIKTLTDFLSSGEWRRKSVKVKPSKEGVEIKVGEEEEEKKEEE